MPRTSRGDAAAATWMFREDESRQRRGCDVDIQWSRVAATPRPRRGYSGESGRGSSRSRRSPVFRYVHGGVYVDCKSGVAGGAGSLDRLRDAVGGALLLARWPKNLVSPFKELRRPYEQFLLVAPPNHPALWRVVSRVVANVEAQATRPAGQRWHGKEGVLKITGPVAFSLAVEHWYRKASADQQAAWPRLVVPHFTDLSVQYNALNPTGEASSHIDWAHADHESPGHYETLRFPVVAGTLAAAPRSATPPPEQLKGKG